MTKLPNLKDKVKLPFGHRKLDPTEKVELGDEFYSETFAHWYAVKDQHIGHVAKNNLFSRPEKKEEINQVAVE